MDDISLYIDYIIVSSFCTPVSSFSLPLQRDLNWSESEMRATSEKYRLNSYDGEELPFENYMKLDNTNPAPDEVAKMIKALFSIEE